MLASVIKASFGLLADRVVDGCLAGTAGGVFLVGDVTFSGGPAGIGILARGDNGDVGNCPIFEKLEIFVTLMFFLLLFTTLESFSKGLV